MGELFAKCNELWGRRREEGGGGGRREGEGCNELRSHTIGNPTLYSHHIKQESEKYNRLLVVMMKTLPQLRKALKGLVAMSEELGSMATSMFNNFVPDQFQAPPAGSCGFLSLMPLNFWCKDLLARCNFIQNWIDVRKPPIIWLSGIIFYAECIFISVNWVQVFSSRKRSSGRSSDLPIPNTPHQVFSSRKRSSGRSLPFQVSSSRKRSSRVRCKTMRGVSTWRSIGARTGIT